nr:hypothetical protein [Deltaproteobacteria bacterium]
MDRKSIILQDAVITRQVNLLRFTAGEKKKVLAILDQLQKDLRVKLLGDLTDFGKARVNKLLKEATEIIEAAYKGVAPTKLLEPIASIAQRYGSLPEFIGNTAGGSYDLAFLDKIARAKEGEIVGTIGDFIIGPKLRAEVGETVLSRPVVVLNRAVQGGKEIAIPGGTFLGGSGKFAGKPAIFISNTKEHLSGKIIGTIMEETAHQKRMALGRAMPKMEVFDWNTYKNLPQEISAEKYVAYMKTIKEDKEALVTIWKEANTIQSTDLLGLARHEAQATAQSFAAIGLDAALPTEAALKAMVNGSLIEGAPSAAWWSKQSDDLAFKFAAQVRQGIAGNETVQQIVRRIIGSPRLGTPGIMETSRRGATALVHTSIQQVANDARLATFKENDDVIKGV